MPGGDRFPEEVGKPARSAPARVCHHFADRTNRPGPLPVFGPPRAGAGNGRLINKQPQEENMTLDPVTASVVAALTAKGAEEIIKKGYHKFKSILKSKFGENHPTVDAIQKLEEKPSSKGRQLMLSEEMVEAGADQDPDVLAACDELKSVVAQHVSVSVGSGAAAVGDNNVVLGESAVYIDGRVDGDVHTGPKSEK
jgi:hypothetical protein